MEFNLNDHESSTSSSKSSETLLSKQIVNEQDIHTNISSSFPKPTKTKLDTYNKSNSKYKRQPKIQHNYNLNFEENVKSMFEKKYAFKKSSNWNLPKLPAEPVLEYQFDSLQELKINLNTVKSKLNDFKIEDWSVHTGRQDPAGTVLWTIKNIINAEFVTQAWCKFYECLCQYDLVTGGNLNTIHLCEAPGAFITGLNHYLQTNYNVKQVQELNENSCQYEKNKLELNEPFKWNYFAVTMNPYYESNPLSNMVMDDRFILHTLHNWLFGEDFTGNIISKDNISHITAEIHNKMQRVDLVTADGSINCMEKPDFQEEAVGKLHYAEISAAINILSDNGNFILKTFTLFEANSVCLVYFLNCCFREVHVFKPATSKCGNSEIYLICLGLNRDIQYFENYLSFLMENLNSNFLLFEKNCIPKDFLIQHEICCRMFMSYQIKAIESNIKTYLESTSHELKHFQRFREQVLKYYIHLYKIIQLPEELKMLYIKNAKVEYNKKNFLSKLYTGSYSERNALKNLSEKEKIENLKNDLHNFKNCIKSEEIEQENFQKFDDEFTLKLYYAKPVSKIESSSFLNIHLLSLRDKIEKLLPISRKFEFFSCELIDDFSVSIKTINFNSEIGDMDFGIKEKLFIKEIIRICLEKDINKLIFNKFPILTHFSASVIKFLWKYIFNNLSIKYKNNYQIILEDRKCNYKKYLIQLNDILLKSEKLFSLVEIKELHKNEFNNILVEYNNSLYFNNFNCILSDNSS